MPSFPGRNLIIRTRKTLGRKNKRETEGKPRVRGRALYVDFFEGNDWPRISRCRTTDDCVWSRDGAARKYEGEDERGR